MAAAHIMERLTTLEEENADLRAQVEWFKRNLFGTGKSETLDALQTRLKLGEEAAQSEESAPAKETISYERAKPKKRDLPAERFKDLPVLETTELIPDSVKADPGAHGLALDRPSIPLRAPMGRTWAERFKGQSSPTQRSLWPEFASAAKSRTEAAGTCPSKIQTRKSLHLSVRTMECAAHTLPLW